MISPVDLVNRMGVGGRLVPFFKCVCVYFVALGGGEAAPGPGAVAAKCAPVLCLLLVVVLHHAALPYHKSGRVRAARGAGAGAVGAGRRAAGVAGAAGGRHGRLRAGARGLHRGLRLGAAARGAGRRAAAGRGGLQRARGAGRAAGRAGGAVRAAAERHGVARRGARRQRGGGRAAVPAVGRRAGLQPVRRTRAVQAGGGDVHVLRGPAVHRAVGAARVRRHVTSHLPVAVSRVCGIPHSVDGSI